MNFKDEYKRDYSQIAVDDAFRNQLAEKMNKTAPAKANIKMITTVVSAAAIVALVVGVGVLRPHEAESDIALKGETVTSPVLTEGLFELDTWYGTAETDEEIYAAFAELMSGGTLETLYCSENDTFSEEDILSDEETAALAEKLAAAVPTDEASDSNVKRCMAVFSGGEIVKFSISDNGIVKLDDSGKAYKFE
ncbi:MAG: hypothetical protein IJ305_08310 [Oscillospiraceae bacterium]|nr:hypothetical protein [Oscillospiraceae bacterium]